MVIDIAAVHSNTWNKFELLSINDVHVPHDGGKQAAGACLLLTPGWCDDDRLQPAASASGVASLDPRVPCQQVAASIAVCTEQQRSLRTLRVLVSVV